MEAMVEALLTAKPDEIEPFCMQWLEQYQKDNDPEEAEINQLRAELDLSTKRRDDLLAELKQLESGPKLTSALLKDNEAVAQRRNSRGLTQASMVSYAASAKGDEDGGGASVPRGGKRWAARLRTATVQSVNSNAEEVYISPEEEAKEKEKVQMIQDKTKRRAGVSAQAISAERIANWTKPTHEKPQEARERLKAIIDANEKLQVLFGHLPDDQLWGCIDAMFSKEVVAGEAIISQGEEGDNFYIVEEGTFEAFVARRSHAEPGEGDEEAVTQPEPTKVCEYSSGGMFGELALMYNAPRAATVKATVPGKLWALDRDSFQMLLMTSANTRKKQWESFLESIELLQDLTKYELATLSDMLESEVFDAGEAIIQQGDLGNYFYILEDGEAKAYIGGDQGELEVKHYDTPGQYFGEIALLKSATRKATVRAVGEGASVLSVNKGDFDKVLGPIKDILSKHIDKYPQYKDCLKDMEEEHEQEEHEMAKIRQMKGVVRRQAVSAPAISEERMKAWKKPFFEKSAETKEKIKKTIDENEKLQVLFGHLTDDAMFSVIDAMSENVVEKGSNVITQGEEGDNFYIVDEGTFDVFVQRRDQTPDKVLEYSPGAMFGELALMYNAPRAATVTATSQAKLFALDRDSFQLMLITAENTKKAQYEEFLGGIDIFKMLTKYELATLSDMLGSELYEAGEDIVKQGDKGSYFFILEDGEARAFIDGDSGEVEVKCYATPGLFFGEVALITDSSRKATVRAGGQGCSLLQVGREDFNRVLGPLKELLQANIDKYPAYTDIIKDMPSLPNTRKHSMEEVEGAEG